MGILPEVVAMLNINRIQVESEHIATTSFLSRHRIATVTASVLLARHERPRWRGRLHAAAFWISLPAGLALTVASRPETRTTVALYMVAIALWFGVSAGYHDFDWAPEFRAWMQRFDHSTIFIVITGSSAPIFLYAMPTDTGRLVFALIAVGATIGVVTKIMFFDQVRRAGWALYLILGWAAVVAVPSMLSTAGTDVTMMVVASGLAYTIGVPAVLLQRPDPWPRIFGYHEVWHGLTVMASVVHFAAVCKVVS